MQAGLPYLKKMVQLMSLRVIFRLGSLSIPKAIRHLLRNILSSTHGELLFIRELQQSVRLKTITIIILCLLDYQPLFIMES